MLNNLYIGAGVMGGLLLAFWFSTVVALGPAPGNVRSGDARNKTEHQQADTQRNGSSARDKKEQETSRKRAPDCSKSQTPEDCLIQLWVARATQQQADSAWWSGVVSVFTLIATGMAAAAAIAAVIYSSQSATAANEAARQTGLAAQAAIASNDLSRELFVATERPWVAVQIRVGAPLKYTENGVSLTLTFSVRNVGRSPAINVWIDPRVYTFSVEAGPINPQALQQQLLAELKGRPYLNWGFMLFPGEEKTQNYTLSIGKDEVDKIRKHMNFHRPNVYGYVTYRFVFDRALHVTSFAVTVERRDIPRPAGDKEPRSTTAIFFDDGDMPADQLMVRYSPIEEEYAD